MLVFAATIVVVPSLFVVVVYSAVSTSTFPHLTESLPSLTVTSAFARSNLSIPQEYVSVIPLAFLYPFFGTIVTTRLFFSVAFTTSLLADTSKS